MKCEQFLGLQTKIEPTQSQKSSVNSFEIVQLLVSSILNAKVTTIDLRWPNTRWVSIVEFHDPTLGIGKVFGQESTVVKWNYQILGLHQAMVRQKLGVILVV